MGVVRAGGKIAAAGALTAVVALAGTPTQVTIAPAQCAVGKTAPMTPMNASVITLSCGNFVGAVDGPGVAMAKPSSGTPAAKWGKPGVGTEVDANLTENEMRSYMKKETVPRPCKTCKTAQANADEQYGVYHIFHTSKSGKVRNYKFGITRVGASRPEGQLKKCVEAFGGGDCDWKWVRKDVRGWYKARMWEGHHAARYHSIFGDCGKGMTKCL